MAKYRIMIRTATGNKDQYQYLTFVNVNGETEIWETDNLVDLDKQVEKMLNGNFRKCDILLLSPLDFSVFADVYDNDKYPPEPEPTPDPDPEPTPEPSTEPVVTDITKSVIAESDSSDPEHPEEPTTNNVVEVDFTAVGENLPEDEEYTWTFTVDENTYVKNSTGASIAVVDEDKDAIANTKSVFVAVGNYTSPVITYE